MRERIGAGGWLHFQAGTFLGGRGLWAPRALVHAATKWLTGSSQGSMAYTGASCQHGDWRWRQGTFPLNYALKKS